MLHKLDILIKYFEYFSICYVFLANSSYLIILYFGFLSSKKSYEKSKMQENRLTTMKMGLQPISMILPAYNEELGILPALQSVLTLNYPEFEVVVVNDGSKDKTLEILIDHFKLRPATLDASSALATKQVINVFKSPLFPNLTVIDKVNGGKADALNCGINHSIYPLLCCVDGDCVFDDQSLFRISTPFFEEPETMIASGGVIRVANASRFENGRIKSAQLKWRPLVLIQVVEYLRAFLLGRMGWNYLGGTTIISGAFGLFKKSAVINVGGYDSKCIGEDFELLMRMHQYHIANKIPYKVSFLSDPVCWTEVPSDLSSLSKQRKRWAQGLAEGLWASRNLFFRPGSGIIGYIALPYLALFELLSAPIELIGYLTTGLGVYWGIISHEVGLLFFAVSMMFGFFLTFGSVVVEEITFQKYKSIGDYIKLCVGVILEQFGFRQIQLIWRIQGIFGALQRKQQWGNIKRTGVTSASELKSENKL